MDRRTRELERHWKGTGEYHTELIRALLREGLLEQKRVICAGFFGHKPSREALPEYIKRRKVIYEEKSLRAEEMSDFIKNIFAFPRDVYFRAAIGAAKISVRQIDDKKISHDVTMMISHLEAHSKEFSSEELEKLRLSARRSNSWWYTWRTASRRQYRLKNALARMMRDVSRENQENRAKRGSLYVGVNAMSVEFKDKHFKKAIKKEVIPYLLGEWS